MRRLLPILLLLVSTTTIAESGSYRVEVIVFRNLEVTANATGVEELRSYSQYPALEESDLPDDLLVVTEKSDSMDNVWRRLRSSKEYRPLLFGAWEQNRTDYYPPLRIHDETVIATELRPPTAIMIADLTAEEPLAEYISSFYRLDGSVQLRRSRFLHIYIDLEIRESAAIEPVVSEQTAVSNSQANFFNPSEPSDTGMADESIHNIYRLMQNRQVRTGELQYFDSPYFGALVMVTQVSAAEQ